jgi:Ring finger domain
VTEKHLLDRKMDDVETGFDSSGTEDYEIPATPPRRHSTADPIELEETQSDITIEDDDCFLIPPVIETIDLCTQFPVRPRFTTNEVIEIVDSPRQAPSRRTPRKLNESHSDINTSSCEQGVKITCPICLESVVKRNPVSTICGHIFCKSCITVSLNTLKECPMCKKRLTGRAPFHEIYL